MEFHQKLQELRKQKGLTQEEVAAALYVSRTAVSKWESARGYPNIDSLKAISRFYSVTIDDLLSGDELLTIAEEDSQQKEQHFRSLVFGMLDCSAAMFFFLPFFGQEEGGLIQSASLLNLSQTSLWLKSLYCAVVIAIFLCGLLTLLLPVGKFSFWHSSKHKLSLLLNAMGTLLFIISPQPYAAAFLFVLLVIRVLMLLKRS